MRRAQTRAATGFCAIFVLLLLALALADFRNTERQAAADERSANASPPIKSSERPSVAGVDRSWLARAQRSIEEREYNATTNASGLQAPNRAHNLRTYFEPTGIRVADRTASESPTLADIRVHGIGRGERLVPLAPGEVGVNGPRVEVTRGYVKEWYVNSAQGVEQGFTVDQRPEGEAPLTIELAVGGARAALQGDFVVLTSPTGRRLKYSNLEVTDANNQHVAARFEVGGPDAVRLVINDRDAAYPLTIDPVITAMPPPPLQENDPNAEFGSAVAGAGDVDGDGYADVIVGAPYYDGGEVDEGAAFVFYGDASGIEVDTRTALESNSSGARFGSSVAGAGDVDGDGYSDVIVGAPWYQAGTEGGRVFVFHGTPSGIDPTARIQGWRNQADARFGSSVAGAGDVNGDGYADVIVGAPEYDAGSGVAGAAFVFHGSSSGIDLDTPFLRQLPSHQASAKFGSSVAAAGDVDSDGYDDVIVGAPNYTVSLTGEGQVYVYRGGPAGIATTPSWQRWGGALYANLGISVAGAGDVNGDGYADVIVGAWLYEEGGDTDEGAAFVFHGHSGGIGSGTALTADRRIQANLTFSWLGHSVAGAGDVNGDGYADVIVGAPRYPVSAVDDGAAFVFLGSPTGIVGTDPSKSAAKLESAQAGASIGWSVAGAGDVNGDGYADVIAGAPWYSGGEVDEGAAFAGYGCSEGIQNGEPGTAAAKFESDQYLAVLGIVAGAGDVNSDGYADVIVGAPDYDAGQIDEGAAFVFHGSGSGIPNGNPLTADAMIESNQAYAFLGGSVAGAGDVNGDGYADVIVGAKEYHDGEINEGAAFVFHGGVLGIWDGAPLTPENADHTIESNQFGARLGWSVAGAGDVNGDGFADVIVGAPWYDGGETDEGAAFIFKGSDEGVVGNDPYAAATRIEFDQAYAFGGSSVAGAGDVNGDGYADVIAGAPYYDSSVVDAGAAFVFHGRREGIADANPATAAFRMTNYRFTNANLGVVAAAGDVNGDGYADVIIGAGQWDNGGGVRGGAAFLSYGSATGLIPSLTPDPQLSSTQAGSGFGDSVAGAGDVNGDGFADVIVGAPWYDAGATDEGAAFIFTGGASGISGNQSSADAVIESNQAGARLGATVAGAGDVNGDGYADVVVGAPAYASPTAIEGSAFVFLGGGQSAHRAVLPRQLRGDATAAVQPWGRSGVPDAFQVRMTASNPDGRGKVKLEIEACPSGKRFGHANCSRYVSPAWTEVGPGAASLTLSETLSGLVPAKVYRWRARVLYAPFHLPETTPQNPSHGPWRRLQAQAFEADVAIGFGLADSDDDGLDDGIEGAAPNFGDGNFDGIPDSQQANVQSLPDGAGVDYVTVEVLSSTGCSGDLGAVATLSEAGAGAVRDVSYDYPFGLVRFRIPCTSADVRLIVYGARRLIPPYRKYGPTTPGVPSTQTWYSLPSAASGSDPFAEIGYLVLEGEPRGTATLHLVDGALGDDTGADGVIVDAGGPTIDATPPLTGKKLLVRDNADTTKRSISFQSSDASVVSAIPGTQGDPTCYAAGGGGATLEVFGTGGSARGSGPIFLSCKKWSVIGKPEDQKGYRYRDPKQEYGPCKKADIMNGKAIKVSCSGKNPSSPLAYDLDTGEGSVGVVLTVGAEMLPYCAEFTGSNSTVKVDDASRFRALEASAPASCPIP